MKPRPTTQPVSAGSIGRLLIVDDDERNRRLLRDILEAQGHTVRVAEDGEQALAAALADPPDVVLLDVMMPRMDGFQVCTKLREDLRTAHVPVLMVTALQDRASMLAGIRAGANDFLTKPVDAEELRLRVRNAVSAKHLYDTVQSHRARLEELGVLRDNLVDMIVHDMRAPLLVVSTALGVLEGGAGRFTSDEQKFHTLAQKACRELVAMASSLLDVSRLEAGEMPLNRAACDLAEIAGDAADFMSVLLREKDLTLDFSRESASVNVDRDIVKRVVVNLIDNAIGFSPDRGRVAISVAIAGPMARLSVADQGAGIAPVHHKRVFEKFGQVGPRQRRGTPSSGLGLTFCKLAVEAHGGRIGFVSRVGQGSVFWIELPRLL